MRCRWTQRGFPHNSDPGPLGEHMNTVPHKHTPGPWLVHPYGVQAGPHNPGFDVGPRGIAVATVIGEFHAVRPGPQTVANATLIAAAPELLAALRDAERWIAESESGIGRRSAEPKLNGRLVLREAQAALAKAEPA
jgi:hypothetical protein